MTGIGATPPDPPSRLQPLADELLFGVDHLHRIVELLEDRRQVILQGPPGTGKTYVARRLAEHLADSRDRGFLVDMNRLFERFVVRALRETLGASDQVLRSGVGTTLDEAGQIRLEPDLSWWRHGKCAFVGDVKYKNIAGRAPGPDLYQLLAYATAFDLPGGLLIYAGTSRPTAHLVRHAGKRLEVASIDLSGSLPETLACVKQVATRIRRAAGGAGSACPPRVTAQRAGRSGQGRGRRVTALLVAHPGERARPADGNGIDRAAAPARCDAPGRSPAPHRSRPDFPGWRLQRRGPYGSTDLGSSP